MKVLVTGANGFIGKNLKLHLSERSDISVVPYVRTGNLTELTVILQDVDLIFHLAGINRTEEEKEFTIGNTDLTRELCNAISECGRTIPVIYTSSTQAITNNPYGTSKRAAEDLLFGLQKTDGNPVYIFRLPNVFGKWCKPNYNSVVATFCHNIARDIPISIHDPSALLTILYIDDLVKRFIEILDGANPCTDSKGFEIINPQYTITVSELAQQLQAFKDSRTTLLIDRVGSGMLRALYSTYLSYLPSSLFSYSIPRYSDIRGAFIEMLKTPDSGQFSCFTVNPGMTRGGHYHHSKTEKFLVIRGVAIFKQRHILTNQVIELKISGDKPQIVESIPGWAHEITNIADEEMIVMLWANEVFDRYQPDTIAYKF